MAAFSFPSPGAMHLIFIVGLLVAPCAQTLADPSAGGSNSTDSKVLVLKGETSLELVWIPRGSFTMGTDSPPATSTDKRKLISLSALKSHESPAHEVTIANGFWIGKYEITQKQWRAVMDGDRPAFSSDQGELPMENVSWVRCQAFLEALNKMLKLGKVRLPTEAEWEYAAADLRHLEPAALAEHAWYWQNSKQRTSPVGKLSPNSHGLYDMLGNVQEWCLDIYRPYHSGLSDFIQPERTPNKVIRGGSWMSRATGCRTTQRGSCAPGQFWETIGLRVVYQEK